MLYFGYDYFIKKQSIIYLNYTIIIRKYTVNVRKEFVNFLAVIGLDV
jgi:hypothetical protein